MKRVPILCAGYLLVISLFISAAVEGYLRTSHEVARAGQTTVLICAPNGPKAVTLDRRGNRVEQGDIGCVHCADCSLVAVFDFPPITGLGRNVTKGRSIAQASAKMMLVERLVPISSRDPPEVVRL